LEKTKNDIVGPEQIAISEARPQFESEENAPELPDVMET
jgi:hypothetical protein